MKNIILKKDIEQMICNNVDYDYEIFLKICDYLESQEEKFESLAEIYKIVYSTNIVEGELHNGGFNQYYGNPTAEEYNELAIKSFRVIGAKETANLLQEVFDKILEQSPTFKSEYKIIGIQNAFNKANDEMDEIHIEECDDKFYKITKRENYKDMKFKYIKDNINLFD